MIQYTLRDSLSGWKEYKNGLKVLTSFYLKSARYSCILSVFQQFGWPKNELGAHLALKPMMTEEKLLLLFFLRSMDIPYERTPGTYVTKLHQTFQWKVPASCTAFSRRNDPSSILPILTKMLFALFQYRRLISCPTSTNWQLMCNAQH